MEAYIDNIVIYSSSWEDHLQHLASVFKALREVGLGANHVKCHLRQEEVTYLVYIVGGGKLWHLINKGAISS